MTSMKFIEDLNGDVVDYEYFCEYCATLEGLPSWPCPEWPEYTVKCEKCDTVLHRAEVLS